MKPKFMEFENKRKKSSYLEVAKELQKNKKTFSIRLINQNQKDEDDEEKEKEQLYLIGKHSILNMKNEEIARPFHQKPIAKKKWLFLYQILSILNTRAKNKNMAVIYIFKFR